MNIIEFFERIDKSMINEFIQRGQEEHLTLEFKTVNKADLSDKQDKKALAKAVSGFANSSGGVIVWGVVAKKKGGIDKAYDKKEIESLSQFVSRLNELTGELVKPIPDGVRHKGIEVSNNIGYAVTLVPESDASPHMAMAFKGRYYKRSGESFYPMEHFDIEDMFGRRKKPNLSLCKDIKGEGRISGPSGKRYYCNIFIGVKNTGRGIAKYVAIAAKVNKPYKFEEWLHHTDREMEFQRLYSSESDKIMYSLGGNVVVHPGSSISILLVPFKIGKQEKTIKNVVVDAEIMAEDMRKVKDRIVIKGSEIRAKIIPENN